MKKFAVSLLFVCAFTGCNLAATLVDAETTYDYSLVYVQNSTEEQLDFTVTIEGNIITNITCTPLATTNSARADQLVACANVRPFIGSSIEEVHTKALGIESQPLQEALADAFKRLQEEAG